MERTILRVEKFLAIILAAFFVLASMVMFGVGLHGLITGFFNPENRRDALLEGIALAAVAFAVLELGGTILGEEMARTDPKRESGEIRRTLSRFLYVVITALAIEGLLMVFKYSLGGQPSSLPYASGVIGATAVLLLAIAVYNRLSVVVEVEEAENPEVGEPDREKERDDQGASKTNGGVDRPK